MLHNIFYVLVCAETSKFLGSLHLYYIQRVWKFTMNGVFIGTSCRLCIHYCWPSKRKKYVFDCLPILFISRLCDCLANSFLLAKNTTHFHIELFDMRKNVIWFKFCVFMQTDFLCGTDFVYLFLLCFSYVAGNMEPERTTLRNDQQQQRGFEVNEYE